jgi:hypothetical protein
MFNLKDWKFLFEEFVRNVSALHWCSRNCCQHFPYEKTLFLKQEFWGLSFEGCWAYCLDIPRRLRMKGEMKGWKFIMIQEIKICETT